MHQEDVDGMANSGDPDQTAPVCLHSLLRSIYPKKFYSKPYPQVLILFLETSIQNEPIYLHLNADIDA